LDVLSDCVAEVDVVLGEVVLKGCEIREGAGLEVGTVVAME
jgi:hypothetical protein